MDNSLPIGWCETIVAEVVRYKKGKKPNKLDNKPFKNSVPYLDIKAIEKKIVDRYADLESSKTSNKNDILIVWDGARCGWVGKGINGAIGSTIMALKTIEINYDYLFYFLRTQFDKINSNPRGTGIPHVDPKIFWSIIIPLAPLPEQYRIISKLNEITSKLQIIRERLEKIPIILKLFRHSVLSAAVSGKLTEDWREKNTVTENAESLLERIKKERTRWYENECLRAKKRKYKKPRKPNFELNYPTDDLSSYDYPKPWTIAFLENLAAIKENALKAGPFGSSLKKECYTLKGYKIYGQEQVIKGEINYGNYYINETKYKELESCKIESGDILISLVGTIGKILIVPQKFHKGIINPRLLKFSLYKSISREYIKYYLESLVARKILKKGSHGGTMEILNLEMLKTLPIPLPTPEEQEEIVRRVEKMFAVVYKIEEQYKKAKEYIDKLPQTILAKAFRGELVPQDPSDEPAEKLLERIKKEKEKYKK